MDRVIKLKHWQAFLILMTCVVLYVIAAKSNVNLWGISSLELKVLSGIVGLVVFFTWILIVGLFLNRVQDNPHHFRKSLLIVAIVGCILGYSDLHLQALPSNTINILSPISFILPFLTCFGLFYTFKNVPQSLRSIEKGEKAQINDYILDSFLMFSFPIGIWFIQPRLNRIWKVNELIKSEN